MHARVTARVSVRSQVRHRSLDALRQLEARGGDMNARHWNGNTVLHEAARSGELEIVSRVAVTWPSHGRHLAVA